MKEVYLHIQDLCPEGQALSDMLLVAYGLALREQRPGDTIFVPSLCLTGVSQKGACTLVWHPIFAAAIRIHGLALVANGAYAHHSPGL